MNRVMHSSATSNYMAKNHLLAVTAVSVTSPSSNNLDHQAFGDTTPVKFAGTKFHTTSPSPKNLPIPVFQSQKESPSSLSCASMSMSLLSTPLSSRSQKKQQTSPSRSMSPFTRKEVGNKPEESLLAVKRKKKKSISAPVSAVNTRTKPITILKPNRNMSSVKTDLDIPKNFEESSSSSEAKSSSVPSLDALSSSLRQMLNLTSKKA